VAIACPVAHYATVNAVGLLRGPARALEATARTGRHYVPLTRTHPVRAAGGPTRAASIWTTSWHAMPAVLMMRAICIGSATDAIAGRQRDTMVALVIQKNDRPADFHPQLSTTCGLASKISQRKIEVAWVSLSQIQKNRGKACSRLQCLSSWGFGWALIVSRSARCFSVGPAMVRRLRLGGSVSLARSWHR
jgi:hypothetical protein